jgi:hypothetical protein
LLPTSSPTSPLFRYAASERGDLIGKYAKALVQRVGWNTLFDGNVDYGV